MLTLYIINPADGTVAGALHVGCTHPIFNRILVGELGYDIEIEQGERATEAERLAGLVIMKDVWATYYRISGSSN